MIVQAARSDATVSNHNSLATVSRSPAPTDTRSSQVYLIFQFYTTLGTISFTSPKQENPSDFLDLRDRQLYQASSLAMVWVQLTSSASFHHTFVGELFTVYYEGQRAQGRGGDVTWSLRFPALAPWTLLLAGGCTPTAQRLQPRKAKIRTKRIEAEGRVTADKFHKLLLAHKWQWMDYFSMILIFRKKKSCIIIPKTMILIFGKATM